MSSPEKSLEEQFAADVAAVNAQWEAAQPIVQAMLTDWRRINDIEMGTSLSSEGES